MVSRPLLSRRWRMVGKRLLQSIPVLFLVTFFSFIVLHLGPGDPALAMAGENPSQASINAIRAYYGLDRPIMVQYGDWLWGVLHGDLGTSMLSRQRVMTTIINRLPPTVLVVSYSMVLAIIFGAILGVLAAAFYGTWLDTLLTGLTTLADAIPYFWLGIVLISEFALKHRIFPAVGMVDFTKDPLGALHSATLPAVALSLSGIAVIGRQLRGALIEQLTSPHVQTLRAKGLPQSLILWKHGLKNVGITLITVIGLVLNRKIGGTVVTETVFAIPGTGGALIVAAVNHDFVVVQGIILMIALIVVCVNLITDILYAVLDPRVD